MQKESKTATKLQRELFSYFEFVHSDNIIIPKFRHLTTYRYWVLGPPFLHRMARFMVKIYFKYISVLDTHFEQDFVLTANMQVISFNIYFERVYLLNYVPKNYINRIKATFREVLT